MKTRLSLIAVLFLSVVSLQAATSYTLDFNTESNSPGLTFDGNYAISPYTGTVNGTTVSLYCDDFNDNIYYGQQNVTVYSTALTANSASIDDDTRYGINNAPNSSYTAGTPLYNELAWLTTQMRAQSGSNATTNDIAIQEAIWTMTNDAAGPDGTSPHNANTELSGSALTNATDTTAQGYLNWITDAQNANADAFAAQSGYATLVPSDWYIITSVSSAGCTIGSNGSTGCTPGTAGTGSVTQEFLAYYNGSGGLVTSNVTGAATPEPASFFLIGSGLLAGSILIRRRSNKTSL